MIRTLSLAAAIGLAATLSATAQTPYPGDGSAAARHRTRQVEANGRCDGISYGTGARRCGTRTGGPVGGISGRN